MTDKREDILVRLLAIAAAVSGIETVKRNEPELTDFDRPAIVLFDADEAGNENDPPNRPGRAPRRMHMTPQLMILVGTDSADVGTALNTIRAALIKAILEDATLATIFGTNGGVRYDGAATDLAHGRTMSGMIALAFTVDYILRSSDL